MAQTITPIGGLIESSATTLVNGSPSTDTDTNYNGDWAGIAVGDWLIAIGIWDQTKTEAGWAVASAGLDPNNSNIRAAWRRYDGTGSKLPYGAANNTGLTEHWIEVQAYRGVKALDGVVQAYRADGYANLSITPAATTTQKSVVALLSMRYGGGGKTDPHFFGHSSPYTELADVSTYRSNGAKTFYYYWQTLAAAHQAFAEPTSPPAYEISSTYSAEKWGSVAFTLQADNTAPNAPTLTSLHNGETINRANVNRASHHFTDPDADDSQSRFRYRYRLVGATTWTTSTDQVTTNQFYDIPAGSLAAGDYERQVQTADAQGLWSVWSASGFFTAADQPDSLTIIAPLNGETISKATIQVSVSYPEMDTLEARVLGDLNGSPDETNVIMALTSYPGATRSFDVTLPNGVTVHIQARPVVDTLAGNWATSTNPVSFTPPAAPTVTATGYTAEGKVTIGSSNPTPATGEPTVTGRAIHRRNLDDLSKPDKRLAVLAEPSGDWSDHSFRSDVSYAWAVEVFGDNGTSTMSVWISDGTVNQ